MNKISDYLFGNGTYNMEITPILSMDNPLEIDLWVEIQTIHEININREYLDATISLDMLWYDRRLTWNPDSFGKLGMY